MTTTLTAPSPNATWPAPAPKPRVTLWLLRAALTVEAVTAVVQPVLAGRYLSGDFDALAIHAAVAGLLMLATMAAFAAAILYWLAGRGTGWPALILIGLFVAVIVQIAVGALRVLAIHIPLGVAIVATAVALAVWSFRPAAQRIRMPRIAAIPQEVPSPQEVPR
jgi:hypothetical protein